MMLVQYDVDKHPSISRISSALEWTSASALYDMPYKQLILGYLCEHDDNIEAQPDQQKAGSGQVNFSK